MTFNSISAFLFILVTILVYWLLRKRSWQNGFLLLASAVFYAFGEPLFILLLGACILVSYYAASGLIRYPTHSKLIFWSSVLALLLLLGTFKYFNFFALSFHQLFTAIGIPFQLITLQIALPIAISFYTFQSIAYLVDVKRGTVQPETSLKDYALFVSFFPQLVAGPIERATNLLKQIKADRSLTTGDINYGVYLVLQGFVKKVVVADNLAPLVNGLLANDTLSAPLIIFCMVGFAFQIYCDFSGYTDIARGISRLMGFKILLNFRQPYHSTNLAEFWRRWHITLSNWFRDYVYIALGGSRGGNARTYFNLLATMSVSGLWHGASANFALWGFYHGVLLIVHKLYETLVNPIFPNRGNYLLYLLGAWTLTFAVTLYGWMLFRVTDFSQIQVLTGALLTDWTSFDLALLYAANLLPFVVIALVVDLMENRYLEVPNSSIRPERNSSLLMALYVLLILALGSDSGGEFIYFRF